MKDREKRPTILPFSCGPKRRARSRDLGNAVNIYNDALEGPIAPDAFHPPPPPGGR